MHGTSYLCQVVGASYSAGAGAHLNGVFEESRDEDVVGRALAVGLLHGLHRGLQPVGQLAVGVAGAVAVQRLRMRQRHPHSLVPEADAQLALWAAYAFVCTTTVTDGSSHPHWCVPRLHLQHLPCNRMFYPLSTLNPKSTIALPVENYQGPPCESEHYPEAVSRGGVGTVLWGIICTTSVTNGSSHATGVMHIIVAHIFSSLKPHCSRCGHHVPL